MLRGGRGDSLDLRQNDLRRGSARFRHVCGVDLFRVLKMIFATEFFEQQRDAALADELADLLAGSERAERGVFGDLIDDEGRFGVGLRLGQSDDGGLQTVEQQASAARVELVGGDAFEYQRDGVQDAAAVGEVGGVELEGSEAGLAGGGVLDGQARGVMVVAELLVAQAGAAAAVAVGEDVAAAVAVVLAGVLVGVGIAHDVFLRGCALPPPPFWG